MAFPTRTATTNADAFSQLRSTASAAGVSLGTLSDVAAVALTVANLLEGDPSTANIPAADVTNGTFGSATSDTGAYAFAGALSVAGVTTLTANGTGGALQRFTQSGLTSGVRTWDIATDSSGTLTIRGLSDNLAAANNAITIAKSGGSSTVAPTIGVTTLGAGLTIAGALAGVTSATFSTSVISTTALATPSALAATQFTAFASTVSGAAIMGFGTTNDVALMNRAGTVVLGIGPNTTAVNMAGTLLVTGAVTFSSSAKSTNATAGIGYATGAGGAVTQQTNRSTGVTLNTITGTITTDSTSLAALASATFTVTNSAVAIGDTVILSMQSGSTANTSIPYVSTVAAGSFNITLYNRAAATADTAAMLINFAVIKAVSA